MSAGRDRRPDWLRWAQHDPAIAQTGLAYAHDPYDRERYVELRRIAVEMASGGLRRPVRGGPRGPCLRRGLPDPEGGRAGGRLPRRGAPARAGAESGRWTFPGGWADVGDTPSLAAERETLEESGYRVKAGKVLAFLDKSRHEHPPSPDYTYKVLIGCRLEGGEPVTSHEIDAVGFFARDARPDLDLDRTAPDQIELAWAHLADPSRPTDFD